MIRRVGPDDVDLVKSLRLSVLGDAPTAYATTLGEAASYPDDVWSERLHPDRHPTFVWEDGRGADGMVVGLFDDDDPSLVTLAAMWVRPTARGTGAADGLVAAVIGWARGRGSTHVRLRVTEGNERAERLYARHGFVRTGRHSARERDRLTEFEMEAQIGSRPTADA